MATFTKRIDSGIRGVLDNYISIRPTQWTASQNTQVLGRATEEVLFEVEYYGGLYNGSFRFTGVTIPAGATITSAKITFTTNSYGGPTNQLYLKIIGVDEDDTAEYVTSPIDTARTRTHTTASVDWDPNITFTTQYQTYDTADFTSVVQEIIDRGGWASGNDLGIYIYDDGTALDKTVGFYSYSSDSSRAPLLTVTYETASPSVSPSSSISPSVSPSASYSPSSSISPSPSSSVSSSPSPSPGPTPNQAVIKIAKPGVNVLTNSDIEKFIFTSEAGTLKYFTKQAINISFDANAGDITAKGEYIHNLGYYPYVEVYVSVYIGSATGVYEYCPFYGSGASVAYNANVKVTTDKVTVYGEIGGVSSSVWHFDFLVFVYKNDLGL